MSGAVELLTSTLQPRSANSMTSSCRWCCSSSPKPDAVYDVKLEVVLSGAYGGSKYSRSPGLADVRTDSYMPCTSCTPGERSTDETARRFAGSQINGLTYRPAGTLKSPPELSR